MSIEAHSSSRDSEARSDLESDRNLKETPIPGSAIVVEVEMVVVEVEVIVVEVVLMVVEVEMVAME